MPTVDEVFVNKHLKAADLGGKVVPLKIAFLELGVEIGKNKDIVSVLHFAGTERTLVLNKTNFNRIVMALHPMIGDKAKNSDNWTGHTIHLYEEMVEYQGAVKPAIRIRAAGQTAPQANVGMKVGGTVTGHLNAPPPASEADYGTLSDELSDEIPF